MTFPTTEEAEKMMNDQLYKIREFTFETLGGETDGSNLMAYVLASISHSAELMWMAKVSMSSGADLVAKTFKSMYEQCEEFYKEGSNEESK